MASKVVPTLTSVEVLLFAAYSDPFLPCLDEFPRGEDAVNCALCFVDSSLRHFVRQLLDMASLRSISTSRPSDRLLGRRLNRTSTSATPVTPRRITLSKTASATPSPTSTGTSSRHRSSRTLSQKSARGSTTSPGNLGLYNPALPLDSLEITTNSFASAKLTDMPSVRASDLTVVSLSRSHAESNGSFDEQHHKAHETFSDRNQFTLDAFDVIRTVGTGKHSIASKQTS